MNKLSKFYTYVLIIFVSFLILAVPGLALAQIDTFMLSEDFNADNLDPGLWALTDSGEDGTITAALDPSAPVIDIWYGKNQQFGQNGVPQEWVNILGNVSDSDGDLATLVYSLNGGGAVSLSIGPDNRRLARAGDFNIDLDRADLNNGSNQVVITATDSLAQTAVETVTVQYSGGNIWALPYNIDWSTATDIQSVAQVVDGKWELTSTGIHPLEIDYDRLVAIGDLNWTDYEVEVPITIHEIDLAGAATSESGGFAALGLLIRWTGHTDSPISGWQPKSGWNPYGQLAWWRWTQGSSPSANLEFYGTGQGQIVTPTLETEYILKVRVESTPGQGGFYHMKAWRADQTEPAAWDVEYQEGGTDLDYGSFNLLAHHVDATFGDVTVRPLSDVSPVLAVTKVGSGTVEVVPESDYSYGQVVTLTATPDSGWTFSHWEDDLSGSNSPATLTMDGDKTVTATFVEDAGEVSTIVSDDFACALDSSLWTFTAIKDFPEDPVVSGNKLQLSVPGGVRYDVWEDNNDAPRLMQPANDTDFELEVKFDSGMDTMYQIQGVIIEQDNDPDHEDFLRFDFHSDGTNTVIFSAIFADGDATEKERYNIDTVSVAPLYMRVKRQGSQWHLSYSTDGTIWNTSPDDVFTHTLSVARVGLFAANGGSAPAHTAVIDYFFNTTSPIDPEDGDRTLTLNSVPGGGGTVTKNPDQATYSCGEQVELTANPAEGYDFNNWSGDASGSNNPVTITMDLPRTVTANFIEQGEGYNVYLPLIQK